MAATPLEDISDGNDSFSAPSEFLLAEFLSAIMRRQYPTALRYCELILQAEPHNATAASFYPLLLQKTHAGAGSGAGGADGARRDEAADGAGAGAGGSAHGSDSASYESLSLDSSPCSSRSASFSLSAEHSGSPDSPGSPGDSPARFTPSPPSRAAHYIPTLSLDDDSCHERWRRASAASGRAGRGPLCSDSSSAEWGLTADENGNTAPALAHFMPSLNTDDEDAENENASGDHTELLKDPELAALRAQFACSIK